MIDFESSVYFDHVLLQHLKPLYLDVSVFTVPKVWSSTTTLITSSSMTFITKEVPLSPSSTENDRKFNSGNTARPLDSSVKLSDPPSSDGSDGYAPLKGDVDLLDAG